MLNHIIQELITKAIEKQTAIISAVFFEWLYEKITKKDTTRSSDL